MVNSVSCLEEYFLPLSVFMGEEYLLWETSPFQVNERSTLSVLRKLAMLEEGGSSTMFL
jgi:hypothetical protein